MCSKSTILKNGFGLIEIVISITLISVALFAFATTSRIAFRAVNEASDRQRAGFLAEEGIEALKTIRDDDWTNISLLTLNQSYHLVFLGGVWNATTTVQLIDGLFTRTFTLSEVFRDPANDNIASSGESDSDTRKVKIEIDWQTYNATRTTEAITYITNLFQD